MNNKNHTSRIQGSRSMTGIEEVLVVPGATTYRNTLIQLGRMNPKDEDGKIKRVHKFYCVFDFKM